MADVSLEGMSEGDVRNLAALSLKMSSDPKTRKDFQRAIKALNPDFTSPELEMDELRSKADKAGELADRLQKLEGSLQERQARERWDEIKREPVKQGLIDESELPELEKYMKDQGFTATQYLQAAKHRKMENQLAVPTAAEMKPFQMKSEDIQAAKKDPKAYLRSNVVAYLNEMNTRRKVG